jgi:hypothetical protein
MKKGTGYLLLAWIFLLVVGVINVIEGVIAIFNSSFWTEFGTRITLGSLAIWGWVVLGWGIVQILAAGSVAKGGDFGRWFGIFTCGIAIIVQFLFIPAYPLWALCLIALYAAIVYGLVMYGGTERPIGE